MSSNRVIQDSDDEDDPLAGPASPRPRVDNTNLDVRADTGYYQAHQTGHDSHMNVNFDQFLQSQESAHYGISSSQQRREARWIPTDAGGGSIGSMMTEIGIAQQRLFDDDEAQYAGRAGYRDVEAAQTESAVVQEQIAAEFPAHDDIALVPNEHPHGYSEQPPLYTEAQPDISDTLPYGTGQHPISDAANLYSLKPIPQTNDLTSFNYSVTTGASYNMFESSLRPSGSFDPENNTPTHPTDTVEFAYKSPRRSDSVPPVPFSPHDTEPFSSVVSPKASRSKSDNAVRQSHQSVDELNGPVTIEIPVAEKKQRGRKKKQSIPEHDDDDELAQHHYTTITLDATTTTTAGAQNTTTNNKPEKRKPGRPPKNPKPPRNEADNQTDLTSNDTTAFPIPLDTTTTTSTDPLATTEHQTATTIDPPPPKKQAKEPKKKKLKRGKTTSITLTKTYESDVEDDVIWIDERPISTTVAPQPEAENITDNKKNYTTADPPVQDDAASTNQNQVPDPNTDPAPAPAPKKRGRKRKNPVEEQPPANPPALPIDAQQSSSSSDKENNPESDSHPPIHDNAIPQQETDQQQPPQGQENENEKENESEAQQEQQKATPSTPLKPSKGPTKHSPISSTTKVPYRVGLSRRARIAPLLKIVRR
ncbi:hypothetical protein AbraIFM66951_008872 [Aspergillus brasiliensis]|uniref:Uncharacterized protein n=1 Tax=Aspergillus brasiliensis TaxID=319629 RepID=A0A9W5YLU9_9EURO|nr:hypothetical protein AbraCBS73388_004876 [Aspergillus brasiliensis]GKZ45988.1 hypothetical protein AbraIFM66951_008872 [Aspergillus brasiliensis]